jgi:hypothetical protein
MDDLKDDIDSFWQTKLQELEDLTPEEIESLLAYKRLEGGTGSGPEKLIKCPHEIVFSIMANVLMENDKGEKTGSREICNKTYHIPVPIDKDYKSYMKAFFEYLEKSLGEAAKNANKISE